MAKFITILGIDKSGKGTLFEGLRKKLPEFKFVSHDRKDVPSDMKFLVTLREQAPLFVFNSFDNNLRSFYYSTMIFAKYFLVKRYLEQGFNVICDSYYYKHLAKEVVFKRGDKEIHRVWQELPTPDLIIFLKIDPEIVFLRSPNNLNTQEYLERPDRQGFVKFQKAVEKQMLKEISGTKVVFVDASKTKKQVLDQVVRVINDFLKNN